MKIIDKKNSGSTLKKITLLLKIKCYKVEVKQYIYNPWIVCRPLTKYPEFHHSVIKILINSVQNHRCTNTETTNTKIMSYSLHSV